jgi:pimeloyl-ACP methyl ester carboxylesterase
VLVSATGIPTRRTLADCLRSVAAGWRHRTPRAWRLVLPDALRARPSLIWRTARALLAQDVRGTLGGIRAPTLVIWGGSGGPTIRWCPSRAPRSSAAESRGRESCSFHARDICR